MGQLGSPLGERLPSRGAAAACVAAAQASSAGGPLGRVLQRRGHDVDRVFPRRRDATRPAADVSGVDPSARAEPRSGAGHDGLERVGADAHVQRRLRVGVLRRLRDARPRNAHVLDDAERPEGSAEPLRERPHVHQARRSEQVAARRRRRGRVGAARELFHRRRARGHDGRRRLRRRRDQRRPRVVILQPKITGGRLRQEDWRRQVRLGRRGGWRHHGHRRGSGRVSRRERV